jgi:hypothetical protein
MDADQLLSLLQSHFDQMLTPDERTDLERMLLESGQAREEFWETARWHALLRQWGEAEWGRYDAATPKLEVLPSPAPISMPARIPKLPARRTVRVTEWRGWVLATAATLVFGVFVGWMLTQPPVVRSIAQTHPAASPAPSSGDHAVLVQAAGLAWAKNSAQPEEGQALSNEWVRLESGAVLLEFARGARVVIDAPAEFKVVSDNEGFLQKGTLRATVPETARGFTIRSGDFEVVDYGTEFGCKVVSGAISEVHVFSGAVDLTTPTVPGASQRLRQSQAMRLTDGRAENIPAEPEMFFSEEKLVAARATDPFVKWQSEHGALSKDPATKVHLTFQPEDGPANVVTNSAVQASKAFAEIVGCERGAGRWPGKRAIKFGRPNNDRLRMEMKGSYSSLTFLAWIRVDRYPTEKASLVMSESLQIGAPRWYLNPDGTLGLDVRVAGNGELEQFDGLRSSDAQRPVPLGKWILVAAVYERNDAGEGTFLLSVDGEQVAFGGKGSALPQMHLGKFEIGNWAIDPSKPQWEFVKLDEPLNYQPQFNGAIDELAIVGRRLAPGDIQAIYEAGRPIPAGGK